MPAIRDRIEHRMYFRQEVTAEARAEGEMGLPSIAGHAIVTGQAADGGYFTEEVSPDAVTKALASPDLTVKCLWNHDASMPLGSYPKSLDLRQDATGLFIKCRPSDTSYARDLVTLIKDGVVNQMSFGFFIVDEAMQKDSKDSKPHFIIKEIELFDVSPVTYPFYPTTDVGVLNSAARNEESFRRRMALQDIPVTPEITRNIKLARERQLEMLRLRSRFSK